MVHSFAPCSLLKAVDSRSDIFVVKNIEPCEVEKKTTWTWTAKKESRKEEGLDLRGITNVKTLSQRIKIMRNTKGMLASYRVLKKYL